jgi:hypothetical protein
MASPALTGLTTTVTFAENTVNATPQVIDSDVTFTDADDDFNGGTLVVSGLSAQDTVSILSGAIISLSAGTVYYDADGVGGAAAVAIGTASGGAGSTFTVTFNASATSAMIDALIENLTYANSSNTPTATRYLTVNVTDAGGADLGPLGSTAFALQGGAANPWDGATTTGRSAPAFGDLDGDGDKDLLVGQSDGALLYFENTGSASSPVFVARTGSNNPLNGVDVGDSAMPVFGDMDGDGDLDLVVGRMDGTVAYFRNTGMATAASFVEQTDAGNPWSAFDVGRYSSPALGDIDGDGDLDLISGNEFGTLSFFRNSGSVLVPSFTQIVGAENPVGGVAAGFWGQNWSTPAFIDLDRDGDLDLIVGGTLGAFRYFDNTGTASAPTYEERTGSANPLDGKTVNFGSNPALLDIDADGDPDLVSGDANSGVLTYYQNTIPYRAIVAINITAVDDPMTLTGVSPSITFAENTVNATPQLLDATVAFSEPDAGFNGGSLTVSGLLAQDTVSILSGATISLSSGTVYYDADGAGGAAAVSIGAATGGAGATFTVTFNAGATSASIDALIENLTYANSSNTPTASRTLSINVLDSVGGGLGVLVGPDSLTAVSGAGNPFNGFTGFITSRPTLADVDGDGDLDLVVGDHFGQFHMFANSGGVFTQLAGGANPFAAINLSYRGTPSFVDLDGDGDLDAVFGESGGSGALSTFINGTHGASGAFTLATGGDDPFSSFSFTDHRAPTFVDLDGDGDKDLVVGDLSAARVRYFSNTGGVFTEQTSGTNPLNGVAVGSRPVITFADLDHDGDSDMLVGQNDGLFRYWENTGTAAAATFVERTGSSNPLNGVDVGSQSGGAFGDIDGDGDLEFVSGMYSGSGLAFFSGGSAVTGVTVYPTITVNVTAEEEVPSNGDDLLTGTGGADRINAQSGADVVDAGAGNDFIDGGEGDDIINAGDGDDYLRGGLGADTMRGGLGNDTYVVDDAGDTTDETGGDGIDLVHSRISWTLGSAIENLTLGNGGSWTGIGNALANVITGNSLANTISGLAGTDTLNGGGGNDVLSGGDDADTLNGDTQNDTLNGGGGADILNGGAHNDALDGGTGADALNGGTGHDSYVVDDAGDVVTEGAAAGTDTVSASISYTLTANVETLALTGSADLNGTGNTLANTINGNSGANVLSGGGGGDILNGLAGNDTLNGEAGNDTLDGGADNDTLSGGAGQDRLTGGANADTFVFTVLDIRRSGPGFGLAADKDVILDLSFAANDRIDLSGIDANALLADDQGFTFVTRFTNAAGQATVKASGGKTLLQLDVDGDGKADLLIEINGNITATTANLYTGGGDTDGGWVL